MDSHSNSETPDVALASSTDHIHLENNVLFPRAQTMEAEVLGRP